MKESVFRTEVPFKYSLWSFQKKRIWMLWVVIVASLLSTVIGTIYVKQEIELKARREFDIICNEIKNKLETKLQTQEQILRSGSAFIENSVEVTREEWRTFVEYQKIEKNIPGIQGIGFSQIIHPDQKESHINTIRKQGFPQYTITPEGEREIYTSIIFIEPFSDRNLRLFGHDMFSEPVQRQAMEYSRDYDIATLSGKVTMPHGAGQESQAGMMMVVPVYHNSMPTGTVEERRRAILGWVYSPYRMNDLMNGILGGFEIVRGKQFRIEVFDDSLFRSAGILYDSRGENVQGEHVFPILTTQALVSFNDHRWVVRFSQFDRALAIDYSKAWIVAINGVLVSILLCLLFLVLLNTNSKAFSLADALTKELRSSQKFLSELIENNGALIYVKDRDGRYELVNKKWENMTGLYRKTVIGRTDVELFPGMIGANFRAHDMQVMEFGDVRETEEILDGSSGKRFFISIKFPLRDKDNGIKGICGISSEITERKHAEAALQKSEQILRLFIEYSPAAIAMFDRTMNYLAASKRYVTDYRLSEQNIIGRSHYEIFPGISEQWKEIYRRCLNGTTEKCGEDVFPRSDGSVDWVRWEIHPWYEITNEIGGIMLFSEIITEKKLAEKTIIESELRYQVLTEGSPVGIFRTDEHGYTTYVNPRWTKISGLSKDDALGYGWLKAVHPDDATNIEKTWENAVQTHENSSSEYRFIHPDGTIHWVMGHTVPERDTENRIIGYVGTITDITERKAAEKALHENEEKYRGLVENSPDAIAIYVDGKIVFVNNQCMHLIAVQTKEELIGKSVIQFVHPDSRARVIDRMKEAVIGTKILPIVEEKFIRSDGTAVDVEVKAIPTTYENKPAVQIIVHDITKRKQAAEAKRQTEEKFRNLVESTDGIVWESDAQSFVFNYVSKQAERLLGYRIDEWYTDGFWADHIHPDDKEKAVQFCITNTKELKAHDFVYRFIAKDGRSVWLKDIVNVVSRDEKPYRLRGLMIDITQQKEMEETLRKSEEKLKKAQHQARMGSWTWTSKKNQIEWSDEMYRIYGLKKEQFTGSINDVIVKAIHPEDRAKAEESNRSVSEHQRPAAIEYRIILPDQSIRVVWAEPGEFLVDEHGNPAFLSGTVQDITERKNNEQIIRDVQRRESIGVLAGGIAHDFNNLLSVMLGNISLARLRMPADHPAIQNIERATSAIERAATLTKQMLAYSGKGKFQIREIDLAALIQEHIALFEVSLPKNVQLISRLSPTPVCIKGDPGQIDQVVMNLIINGGEAIGKKQGIVSIEISTVSLSQKELIPYSVLTNTILNEGSYALLQVTDTGSGMSKETQEKIFDPFFTTKFIGRGLGLSAVLGIIRGNDGGLAIESTEGTGTTFRVLLPLIHPSEPETSVVNNGNAASSIENNKILVIDDEEFVVEMVADILESGKYRQRSATDSEKGLELYQEEWKTIDLVILDFSMPVMNGKEVLIELRKINPNAKVIISSGYTEEEIFELMGEETPSAFIQKPYTQQSLLSVVKKVLESA